MPAVCNYGYYGKEPDLQPPAGVIVRKLSVPLHCAAITVLAQATTDVSETRLVHGAPSGPVLLHSARMQRHGLKGRGCM